MAFFIFPGGMAGSTGQPSEQGLLVDATAAYDWLMAKGISPDKLVVVGESLGTGPAVQLPLPAPWRRWLSRHLTPR